MSSANKTTERSTERDAPELSTPVGVRTLISMLLIIHLTAIVLAIVSNFGPVSALRVHLGDVPILSDYMKTINQHHAYNYHLTYGGGFDVDHQVELEIQPPEGSDSTEPIVLTPFSNAVTPLLARNRYRNLTFYMATSAENDEVGGILPLSISARLLKEQGIDSGVHAFRLKSLLLLDTSSYDNSSANMLKDPSHLEGPNPYADDLYRTLYSANIFDYNGKWLLNKAVAAGQTAPVRSLAPAKQDANSNDVENNEPDKEPAKKEESKQDSTESNVKDAEAKSSNGSSPPPPKEDS